MRVLLLCVLACSVLTGCAAMTEYNDKLHGIDCRQAVVQANQGHCVSTKKGVKDAPQATAHRP